MSIAETLVTWVENTFLPYGEFGLFFIAFIESAFFPIPPDVILIPLAIIEPSLALYYAAVCTIGSVLGAILGYQIGRKGGRPLVDKFVSKKRVKRIENMFKKHGAMAILLSAFSPIPYKVFTISSGIMKYDIKKLLGLSVIGRGARFFLEAFIILLFGEKLMEFFLNYFEVTMLIVAVIIIIFYYFYYKLLNNC